MNNCFIFIYCSFIIGATPIIGFFLSSFHYGTWYHFFFTCYAGSLFLEFYLISKALQITLFFLLNTKESTLKLISYLLAIIFFRVVSPHAYGAVQVQISKLLSHFLRAEFYCRCTFILSSSIIVFPS